MVSRRNFLKASSSLGIGAIGLLSACSPGKELLNLAEKNYQLNIKRQAFPKLKISIDRIVKETVGLRPFRTLGPRIERQELGNKYLIHNYGHGGSGWSLSWGCAQRAVALIPTSPQIRKIAVLGGGVSGLTTATLLQERGFEVKIYAKELAPHVTSSKATGTWSPAHYLIDDEYVTEQFVTQWKEDAKYSFRRFQDQLGLNERIAWTDAYQLSYSLPSNNGGGTRTFQLPDLLPKAIPLEADDHPFKNWQVGSTSRLVFNIPLYLDAMMQNFLAFGGKMEIREIKTLEDIDALGENCIINCMGLGSKAIFDDEELIPVSGQLSFLLPQADINYCIMTPNGYSIPRKDGIILGGNHIRGSWDTTPKKEQTEKVVAAIRSVTENMVW